MADIKSLVSKAEAEISKLESRVETSQFGPAFRAILAIAAKDVIDEAVPVVEKLI